MRSRHQPRMSAVAAVTLALTLAGCTRDARSDGVPSAGSTPVSVTAVGAEPSRSSCSPASAPRVSLPAGLPSDLPMPPAARIGEAQTQSDRVSVSFDAPVSVDTAVHAVNDALPAAGYTVGDAEMEQRDAEIDFSGHGVRGRYQFIRVADCSVRGTVTVQPSS